MKLLILTIIVLLLNNNSYAYDFEVDGFYYNRIAGTSNKVELTCRYSNHGWTSYTGQIFIPETIVFQGKTYYVTAIGDWAFYSDPITFCYIPSSIVSIGEYAFSYCHSLTSITLPNSIESIGEYAFDYMDYDFTTVKSKISNPFKIDSHTFSRINQLVNTLYVPNGTKSLYSANWWNIQFDSVIESPNEVDIKISANGNGYTYYHSMNLRNHTHTTECEIGKAFTMEFEPDEGYFLSHLFVNGNDVTSSVFKDSYTISNIQSNTIVEVEFEAIPPTAYTLSIKSIGNGSVSYNGTSIRNTTKKFTVNEGTSATISITPDDGYRIKSVKKGGTDVTTSVSNNKYTLSNIQSNTSVEVEFEAITHTLSIKATGNGSASYNSTAIRNTTKTFTVNEGTSATISITPDDGYRIKSVKKNGTDITSNISGNKYSISNIQSYTSVEIEFEAITHTLSIKASGNGSVSYSSTAIRNTTKTFTVNEGSSATISITPDDGHRIKTVKKDGTNVTSSVSNNKYTVSNIQSDTSVDVEFEAIPPTTYTLSITATGNGEASYNNTSIRNATKSFSVNEGSYPSVNFYPDNGYRVKSAKINGNSSSGNVAITLQNVHSNNKVEVEFEAIPPTTYSLTVKATGNGSVSYNSTTIRNTTKTFTVNEGTSATISITPDDGYRIKSVKKDGTDVTSSVSNNKYTLNKIQSDTSVEVEFEAITHILSIKATGNGVATYEGTNIRNKTISFTINEGSSAVVKFTPDNGCRIKSMKLNSTDVTSNVINNQYTISNITADMSLEVEFEAIPPTTYTLFIKATGNGSVSYNSTAIRNTTKSFTVNEGTSATISFTPDNGYHIKSVKVNNTGLANVESQVSIDNIMENTTVEVGFEANPTLFACEGINYSVTSYDNKTVRLAKGNYGKVLEVPSTISYMDTEWTVTGVDEDAFDNAEELAAIIWHPVVSFNATVVNPNLLLYVNKNSYAPISIKNVVVNGTASSITLTDAESGNNFYCPQEFTAQRVSYSHNYKMTTGIGVAKGWETIALPFDVQTVTHEEKGEIVPFTKWQSGNSTKPFWLMRLEENGWKAADGIKANTPYIISMPNNSEYKDEFLLNGRITFSAGNVTVRKTENMQTSSYKGRTFVPTYTEQAMGSGLYVLNVDNDYETNVSGVDDGSHFVLNLRKVHPFEAYMVTSTNGSRAIDISDGMDDGIDEEEQIPMRVYNLKGLMMKTETGETMEDIKRTLPAGVYIINGHKMIVK